MENRILFECRSLMLIPCCHWFVNKKPTFYNNKNDPLGIKGYAFFLPSCSNKCNSKRCTLIHLCNYVRTHIFILLKKCERKKFDNYLIINESLWYQKSSKNLRCNSALHHWHGDWRHGHRPDNMVTGCNRSKKKFS